MKTIKLDDLLGQVRTAVREELAAGQAPPADPPETDEEKKTREAAEAAARLATKPGTAPAAKTTPTPGSTAQRGVETPDLGGATPSLEDGIVDAKAGRGGKGKFSRYRIPRFYQAQHRNMSPDFLVRQYKPGDQELAEWVVAMCRAIRDKDPTGYRRYLKERALGEDTGATGGFLVPDEFTADVIMKEGELTPFATSEFIRVIPMGTDTMNVTVLDTRPTVDKFGENKPPADNVEPRWSRVELRARKFGEVIPISNEVLSDANIGVLEFLRDLYAEVLAEKKNQLVTNGQGAQEPQGFRNDDRIATFAFTGTQTSSADIIDWVDGLFWRLKAKERRNAVWTASSLMLETLDKIKDDEGRPLMGRLTDSPFRTLKGRVVLENDDIPDDLGGGSDESELIFANFKKYVVGDRQSMTVDTDTGGKFFEADQTAMRVTERYDGRVGQPDAFIIGVGKEVQ